MIYEKTREPLRQMKGEEGKGVSSVEGEHRKWRAEMKGDAKGVYVCNLKCFGDESG